MRESLVNALGGPAADVVIDGENRPELAALVLPSQAALRAVAGEGVADDALLSHPAGVEWAAALLFADAASATGSANRVRRMMSPAEPPQVYRGEVTDKGSLNQRAILRNRAELVEALYRGDDAGVIVA